ncbi:MAG TPA: ChaN family lipoprotein [Myxococcota bacterium]|nr:ChaN family lipoprotein [Myxococcota bacterium]
MRTALALLLLATACAGSGSGSRAFEISSSADHPLAGVLWSTDRSERIDADRLAATLEAARFVLLGERHDNPEHHRLQTALVERLSAGGRRPAVVFEMLDRAEQPVIDALLAERRRAAAGLEPAFAAEALAARVDWAESGWPDFDLYRALFEAVLAADLPILAAGLPQGENLPPDAPERDPRYGLDEPLPPAEQEARLEEMFVAHCEQVPRELLAPMVARQRARDVRMAHRLWQGARTTGRAILIAGNGHVKRGRVADPLVRAGIDRRQIVSVGLLELDPDLRRIEETRADRFDVVVFTPAIEREDPCEALRRRFEGASPHPDPESDAPPDLPPGEPLTSRSRTVPR